VRLCFWLLSEKFKVLYYVYFSATTASRKQCTTAVGTPVTALSSVSRSTGTANINAFVVVSVREHASAVMYIDPAVSVCHSCRHCARNTLLYVSSMHYSFLQSVVVSLVLSC